MQKYDLNTAIIFDKDIVKSPSEIVLQIDNRISNVCQRNEDGSYKDIINLKVYTCAMQIVTSLVQGIKKLKEEGSHRITLYLCDKGEIEKVMKELH